MALIGIEPEPNTPGEAFVFIPSIYGEYFYSTIYYGGQWLPLGLGPGQPVPISTVTFPQTPYVPAGYNIAPFTAVAVDYGTIFLSWSEPQGPFIDFRILRSRYGFPVDENDGAIVADSSTNITGNQFYDNEVIPGTMQYYGIYILLNLSNGGIQWYRAGLTACLAIGDTYDSTDWLMNKIPEYYKIIGDRSELTTSDATNNKYLDQFMSILGWGTDYVKTYLALAAQVNNPHVIPVNWLEHLAGTLGAPFYSEVSQTTTRGAISNYTALIKERGSLQGIEAYIAQFTGWGADIRLSSNLMLEEDQSHFTDPIYTPWSPSITYNSGEIVNYQLYNFQALQSNYNTAPFINQNPFFTNGSIAGWVGYGGSVQSVNPPPGIGSSPFTWALQFITNASGSPAAMEQNAEFAVTPGNQYTLDVWVYVTSSATVQYGFDWDTTQAFQSTSLSSTSPSINTWTHLTTTKTAPNNANVAFAYPRIGCTASGITMYIQGAIVYAGGTQVWSTEYYSTTLPPAPQQMSVPNTGRTDTLCSTTAGNPTVSDTNAILADQGLNIYNANIPAGTVIVQVQVGQGYILSNPPTATASSQNFVIAPSAPNDNLSSAYLKVSSGTVTAIYVNSVLQATTSGTYLVPQNGYVSLIYSVAPTFNTYAPQLLNPVTGWLNTWEPLMDNQTNQVPNDGGALIEMLGTASISGTNYDHNSLAVVNTSGSSSDMELRSVARATADVAAGNAYPDRAQVIGDGIPVPWTLTSQQWSPTVQYLPGAIVTYESLPMLALTASLGVTPPTNGVATDQWQPVGYDQRIALMLSGYSSQNLATQPGNTVAVTPYVIWFDTTGALINSGPLYIRTNLSGAAPQNIFFDSFALPSNVGSNVTATTPDIGGVSTGGSNLSYTAQVNNFAVNGYNNGCVIPSSSAAQNIVTVNYTSANAVVGVTLAALPSSGFYSGLVLRFSSSTSYIRVDQNQIVQVSGSTNTVLATHLSSFQAGDRMVATVQGNNITVTRNGIQVSSVTTAFNNSQTKFGMIMDNVVGINPGTSQAQALKQLQSQTKKKRKKRATKRGNLPNKQVMPT